MFFRDSCLGIFPVTSDLFFLKSFCLSLLPDKIGFRKHLPKKKIQCHRISEQIEEQATDSSGKVAMVEVEGDPGSCCSSDFSLVGKNARSRSLPQVGWFFLLKRKQSKLFLRAG